MQDTIVMQIFVIAIIIMGIYIIYHKKERYKLMISPIFWLLTSWTICLALYLFSGINYKIKLELYAFLYIIIVILVFGIGYILSKYKQKKSDEYKEKIIDIVDEKKLNLLPLFYISLISVIIYTIYMFSINNIEIGVTRNINTDSFATLLLLLSNSSLVIWLYELAYAIINDKMISKHGIISAIIYNIPCMIISGRDALILFLISSVIVCVYLGNYVKKELKKESKIYKRIKIMAVIIIVVMIIYLILLSSKRYGNNIDSAINMYRWSSGCEFPEYLENIYYGLGGVGKLILNVIFYYSSQISKLSLVITQYDGPYLGGLYQLHYISRLLPESWNLNYSLISESIGQMANSAGVQGLRGFWETAIGYSIYDFGKIGTIIIGFIGGFVVGKINIWTKKRTTIIKILMQCMISVAMFLTVEISPLFDYYYIFPMFWLIVITIIYYKKKV